MYMSIFGKSKIANLKDYAMAIDSLREEMEAVKLYHERADEAKSASLREIFLHNANEEKEHAAMLLADLAKQDAEFGAHLHEFLLTKDVMKSEKKVKK